MRKPSEQAAEERQRILDAVVNYMMAHNYPPTYSEISERTGINSYSTINKRLEELQDRGIINHEIATTRGIEVFGIHYVDERGKK